MSQSGEALKQVLNRYGISQNKLAVAMGIGRSTVNHWVKQLRDPSSDAVLEIRKGLKKIDVAAAEEFIRLYLEEAAEEE